MDFLGWSDTLYVVLLGSFALFEMMPGRSLASLIHFL
jgi:hypothetical protein